MNVTETYSNTPALVANGGVATVLGVIYQETLYNMLPFLLLAVIVIVMDLYYGVKAARLRGEVVRTSRAARRTIAKIFEYLCWTVMGAMLSVAFKLDWLDAAVIGLVMAIECVSLVSNALYCKGYKVTGLEDALVKHIGKRAEIDTSDIKIRKKNGKHQS